MIKIIKSAIKKLLSVFGLGFYRLNPPTQYFHVEDAISHNTLKK